MIMPNMMLNKLKRILKHLWLDEGDANRAVPADMVERLTRRRRQNHHHRQS